MGHERLGVLPKSKKWREIVCDVSRTANNECSAGEVVRRTAKAIDGRLRRLHLDASVQDAFSFLVAVTVAARSKDPSLVLKGAGIELSGKRATPLSLTQSLSHYTRSEGASLEYTQLARSAASKALAEFYRQESRQADLFSRGEDPFAVWRKASDGSGFCNLARQFFANLTAGYLEYFLDREASAVIPTLEARERFQRELEAHVDQVTHHSFETSKIAQSFAAGWYNKNAMTQLPSRSRTKGFLNVAINKIRDSLAREGQP